MRLYLCGPMRGLPLNNYPAFNEAASRLRALGHQVFNPAEEDGVDNGRTFTHFMERDLPEVCRSEAVVVLPGWRESRTGAFLETHLARLCRKPLYDSDTLTPIWRIK